jgi:hypothetical protein
MVAQVSKTCCAADFRIGIPQAGWESRSGVSNGSCFLATWRLCRLCVQNARLANLQTNRSGRFAPPLLSKSVAIFPLLHHRFSGTVEYMPNPTHHQVEAAWRLTVESWLVCQGLITLRPDKNPNVSTRFPKNWSHN